jgi:hypothetical protein
MPVGNFDNTDEIKPGPGFFGGMVGRARLALNSPLAKRNKQNAATTAATTVRYGVPIAAGIATGPAGFLTTMGVMGGAGVAGELGAQAIEGQGIDKGEVAAQGIMAAVPLSRVGALTPFMGNVKRAGVLALRGATQVGTTAAFEQGAEYVRDPEGYRLPQTRKEAWDRLTSPTALIGGGIAVGGGALESVSKNMARSQAMRAERGSGTGMLASELSDEFIPLEARRFLVGDSRVRTAMRDLYADIDQTVLDSIANAPDSNTIAAQIAPAVGKLKKLQAAAQEAEAASVAAQEARRTAVEGAGEKMSALAEAATAKAAEAAKKKHLYEQGVDKVFGKSRPTPTLEALSPSANTATLSKVLKTTFDEQKAGLGRLFDEVGIDINDPLFTKDGVLRRIDELAKTKDSVFRGDEARAAAIAEVEAAFPSAPGQELKASRERYLNFRDDVANRLEQNGMIRSRAERYASELYGAVRGAADDFIAKTKPEKVEAWSRFNKTAANWFEHRDSAFIQDFVDPSTGTLRQGKAKEMVDRLVTGQTEGFTALSALGDAIAANGDEASVAAANSFKESVSSYIAKGVLESAVTNRTIGVAADTAIFDAATLYQTVNKLASSRFPVERLGLGTPKDLNALAKMANNKFLTKAEVDDFFSNLQTLGGDAAAARIEFRRAIRKELLEGGSKRINAAVQRKTELARRAKHTAESVQAELKAAQQDPLVVMFGEGNFNFTSDLTDSKLSLAISDLRTVPTEQVARFMGAVEAKNPALAQQIRARTAADIFASYADFVPGVTPETDVKNIRNLFFNPSDKYLKQRNAIRTIMGRQEFTNLQNLADKIGGRSRLEARLLRDMDARLAKPDDALRGAIAAGSIAQGKTVTGQIYAASIGNVRNLWDNAQYSTLHYLYINPRSARNFASVGFNLDKFVNQSGLHRVALQIAERKDEERKAEIEAARAQNADQP